MAKNKRRVVGPDPLQEQSSGLQSQILPTAMETNYRIHPYETIKINDFRGWDPDSGDFDREVNAFLELHNYRFEHTGVPVTRTGIKQFTFTRQQIEI